MRLIDADKLLFILKREEEYHSDIPTRADGIRDAIMDVLSAPTVDAVPVQRCDGCRYADWHSNGCIAYCTKHGTDGHVADGFCSEGEKDGEQHDTK